MNNLLSNFYNNKGNPYDSFYNKCSILYIINFFLFVFEMTFSNEEILFFFFFEVHNAPLKHFLSLIKKTKNKEFLPHQRS